MLQQKKGHMRACLCVCVPACVRACARVRGAREFVRVVAEAWLWGPLVHGGIIIVTTTTITTTTPEDDLDYTATTAATPHAALVGNR